MPNKFLKPRLWTLFFSFLILCPWGIGANVKAEKNEQRASEIAQPFTENTTNGLSSHSLGISVQAGLLKDGSLYCETKRSGLVEEIKGIEGYRVDIDVKTSTYTISKVDDFSHIDAELLKKTIQQPLFAPQAVYGVSYATILQQPGYNCLARVMNGLAWDAYFNGTVVWRNYFDGACAYYNPGNQYTVGGSSYDPPYYLDSTNTAARNRVSGTFYGPSSGMIVNISSNLTAKGNGHEFFNQFILKPAWFNNYSFLTLHYPSMLTSCQASGIGDPCYNRN